MQKILHIVEVEHLDLHNKQHLNLCFNQEWILQLGYLMDISHVEKVDIKTLKVVSATFLLVCFLSLKESICKTWKNVSYFISKAFFDLEKIKF